MNIIKWLEKLFTNGEDDLDIKGFEIINVDWQAQTMVIERGREIYYLDVKLGFNGNGHLYVELTNKVDNSCFYVNDIETEEP